MSITTIELEPHILQKYEIKKRLGKGAYGIVWKAVDKQSGAVVALKKIFDAFRNQTDAQRTYREIIFLQAFGSNANVISLLSLVKAENHKDIYLVFEFMETDLHNVIKRGNILKDVHKKYIMYQLCKVTKYLHSGNVIHRDLKPSNVLLDSDCFVKLCDFGLARSLSQAAKQIEDVTDPSLTEYVATRWYRAPEILLASHRYTKGVDMWSLGCILAEMMLNRPAFPGSSTLNQIERILQVLPQPSKEDIAAIKSDVGSKVLLKIAVKSRTSLQELVPNCDADAMDLLQKLLVFNPDKRITTDDACRHAYVRRFHAPSEEFTLNYDVLPPLNDDTMLSIDEYRNKLHEIATGWTLASAAKKAAALKKEKENGALTQSSSNAAETADQKAKAREVQSAPVAFPTTLKSETVDKVVVKENSLASDSSQLTTSSSSVHQHQQHVKAAPVRMKANKPVTVTHQTLASRATAAEYHGLTKTHTIVSSKPQQTRAQGPTPLTRQGSLVRSKSVTKIPNHSYVSANGNPQILRDVNVMRIPSSTLTRTRSGTYTSPQNQSGTYASPQSRKVSAGSRASTTSTGKRQYAQVGSQPSAGNARHSMGSYSQAYGSVSSMQLHSLLGRKAV